MHILAIDDERGALNVLTKAIRKAVPLAQVHGFQSALEALDFARKTSCGVAFLDIEMAEMNGIDLAKKLKELSPKINIIFVTGYSQYTDAAFALHVSGYIYKPVTASAIITEMENLRHPLHWRDSGIFVQTFGNFDLLVNGKPVSFHRSKAKEALAYLVDRRGSSVNRRELASILFENREYSRESQNYLTKILRELAKTLEEAGAGSMLVRNFNSYAVDPGEFSCDLYEYEKKNATPELINCFQGEYMAQYSWAEYSLANLLWKNKKK